MAVTVSQTEAQALAVLRTFLLSVLPAGVEVVRGQSNRVPEPAGDNYLVLWPILQARLSTNVVTYFDDPSGQRITIPGVPIGTEGADTIDTESGFQITTETTSQIGPGTRSAQMSTKITVQVDVHGPASGDNVQAIATLYRDEYATGLFRDNSGASLVVAPLYAADPRMVPFLNAEQQYERRWTIDLVMQVNPVITTPQQFMDVVHVGLISVDAVYHP
jgi:hypothetical protein